MKWAQAKELLHLYSITLCTAVMKWVIRRIVCCAPQTHAVKTFVSFDERLFDLKVAHERKLFLAAWNLFFYSRTGIGPVQIRTTYLYSRSTRYWTFQYLSELKDLCIHTLHIFRNWKWLWDVSAGRLQSCTDVVAPAFIHPDLIKRKVTMDSATGPLLG